MVFQHAAYAIELDITPGPLFDLCRMLSEKARPWFILTARSGFYAVKRLYRFIEKHNLKPIEIFDVGRVDKRMQVEHVCEIAKNRVVYVEDSQRHVDVALQLGRSDLSIIYLRNLTSNLAQREQAVFDCAFMTLNLYNAIRSGQQP